MKKIVLALYMVLLVGLSTLNIACMAEIRGPRWHYDHDYNDDYRAHHVWHEDKKDWDR